MEPMLNDRVNETTACLQRRIAQSWPRTCHQDRTTDPRKKASSGMRAIARLPLLAFSLYLGADGETRTRTACATTPSR